MGVEKTDFIMLALKVTDKLENKSLSELDLAYIQKMGELHNVAVIEDGMNNMYHYIGIIIRADHDQADKEEFELDMGKLGTTTTKLNEFILAIKDTFPKAELDKIMPKVYVFTHWY